MAGLKECLAPLTTFLEQKQYANNNVVNRLAVCARALLEDKQLTEVSDVLTHVQSWKQPIVDIKLSLSKKPKHIPDGYELVENSLGEAAQSDLNKRNGGKSVYLLVKRQKQADEANNTEEGHLAPITALAVVLPGLNEEAPHKFQVVDGEGSKKNTRFSNLSVGSGMTAQAVNLCVSRGWGAPITDVGIVYPALDEKVPSDFHAVQATPFGSLADLNAQDASQKKKSFPIFVCFKQDVAHVLQTFTAYNDRNPEVSKTTRVLALLACCLYAEKEDLAIASLQSFRKLHTEQVPAELLTLFLQTLCDAAPSQLSYFSTDKGLTYTVKFLRAVARKFVNKITLKLIMSIIEVCFLMRHEDKLTGGSIGIINALITSIDSCKRCACELKSGRTPDALTIPDLCVSCREKKFLASATATQSAQFTISKVMSHVVYTKELETHVNKFQRHHGFADAFHSDVAIAADTLFAMKDWFGAPATTATTATAATEEEEDLVEENIPNIAVTVSASVRVAAAAPTKATVITPPGIQNVFEFKDGAQKRSLALTCIILMCCQFADEEVPFTVKKSEALKRKHHALQLLQHVVQNSGSLFRASVGGGLLLRRFVFPSLIKSMNTDYQPVLNSALQLFTVIRAKNEEIMMIEQGIFVEQMILPTIENPHAAMAFRKDALDTLQSILRTPHDIVHFFYNYDNHTKNWQLYEKTVETVSRFVEGDFKESFMGQTDTKADAHITEFKTRCLKFLVHLTKSLAEWLNIPKLSSLSKKKNTTSLVVKESKLDLTRQRIARTNTWAIRFDKQKSDKKILAKAFNIVKKKNLTHALKYLKIVHPIATVPQEIAKFMFDNQEHIDAGEIGDILGSLDENKKNPLMDEEDYRQLRLAYVSLLDFTNMRFAKALRHFLCDCGFRLPGEAQKIDRLLESFCSAYCRDNPSTFEHPESSSTLAFAMIILNTDHHDPRLVANRKMPKMSLKDFIKNLRGCNGGNNFPRQQLINSFDNISNEGIVWAEDVEKKNDEPVILNDEEILALRENFMDTSIQTTISFARNNAVYRQGRNSTGAVKIVLAMFSDAWFKLISAFRANSEIDGSLETLTLAIEGLAWGGMISINLGLTTERMAFTEPLAALTYMSTSAGKDTKTVREGFSRGNHLQQEWYKPFNILSEKHPNRACSVLMDVLKETVHKITYSRTQAKLSVVQSYFSSDVKIADPDRRFIKEGKLFKLHANGGKQLYTFFLFNDLLIYGTPGTTTKYKVHRVLHLSLCTIVDMGNTAVFKIKSTQKTVMIGARSPKQKAVWMQLIITCIQELIQARQKYIDKLTGGGDEQEDAVMEFRRYSTFIGSRASTGDDAKAARPSNYCKLCIRNFTMFRRRNKCPVCEDVICGDCNKNKHKLKKTAKRGVSVCDACFAGVQGHLNSSEQCSIQTDGEKSKVLSGKEAVTAAIKTTAAAQKAAEVKTPVAAVSAVAEEEAVVETESTTAATTTTTTTTTTQPEAKATSAPAAAQNKQSLSEKKAKEKRIIEILAKGVRDRNIKVVEKALTLAEKTVSKTPERLELFQNAHDFIAEFQATQAN